MDKNKTQENVYFHFLGEYFRNFRDVGAIGPDSAACVKSLLKQVPFDAADVILEYGSASGAVTREIIRKKRPETLLICFEKNGAFFNRLKHVITGRNVYLVNGDVFNSAEILSSRFRIRNGDVHCIVSTLPCSSMQFDELLRKSVLPLLSRDGVFIQYMHTLSALKGFRLGPVLYSHFGSVETDFVFFNIPPAVIYACRRSDGAKRELRSR